MTSTEQLQHIVPGYSPPAWATRTQREADSIDYSRHQQLSPDIALSLTRRDLFLFDVATGPRTSSRARLRSTSTSKRTCRCRWYPR